MTISISSFLGLLISSIAGLAAGVHSPAVIVRPIISAMCMAALGAGIYFLLQWQAPELLSWNNDNQGFNDDQEFNDDQIFQDDAVTHTNSSDTESSTNKNLSGEAHGAGKNYDDDGLLSRGSMGKVKHSSVSGDTIVVDGVPIPNKPELIGQAIQHVLDMDDDNE